MQFKPSPPISNNNQLPMEARSTVLYVSKYPLLFLVSSLITLILYIYTNGFSNNPLIDRNQVSNKTESVTETKELSPTPFFPKVFYSVPPTNSILISDWKTYKGEKYLFAFLYPSYMYANTSKLLPVEEKRGEEETWFATKPISPDDLKNSNQQELLSLQEGLRGGLVVSIDDEGYVNNIFSGETLGTLKNTWTDYKYESIMIGGKSGRIISGFTVWNSQKSHLRNIDIPLQDGKHLYISYSEDAITLGEFNQILSTFKFTN